MDSYSTNTLSEMVEELENLNKLQKVRFSDIYDNIKIRQLEKTEPRQSFDDLVNHETDLEEVL